MKKFSLIFLLGLVAFSQSDQNSNIDVVELQEAIDLALENNEKIKEGELNIENSQLQLDSAKKQGFFDLTWGAGINYLDVDSDGIKSENNYYTNAVSLTQPVYRGGLVKSGIKYAETSEELAEYSLISDKKSIKLNVVKKYIDTLILEKKLEVNEISKKSLEKNHEIISEKYNLRLATKPDYLESERSVLQSQVDLFKNKNDIEISKENLKDLMNYDMDKDIKLVSFEVPEKIMNQINLQEDLKRIEDENTEYLISEANTRILESQVDIVKSTNKPNLDVVASYGLPTATSLSTTHKDVTDIENYDLTVGLSLSWKIYDWGKNDNDIGVAKNNVEISKLKTEELLRSKQIELKNIYYNLLTERGNISVLKKAAETANEIYKLEQERYSYGLITLNDLLDAEKNKRESEINYYTEVYNFNYSMIEYQSLLD